MTKLEAINIILMYINELPVTQTMIDATTPIPPIVQAELVLGESMRAINSSDSTSYTDISQFDLLIQDYIVKRASENIFTRTFGFEDKGIEVIVQDKQQHLGSVAQYITNSVFTPEENYRYYIAEISSLLLGMSTFEQMKQMAKTFKSKIDTLNSYIVGAYSFLDGNQSVNEYILNKIGSESGSEIGLIKEANSLNGIAEYVYSQIQTQNIADEYVYELMNSIPVEKQKIKTINDITGSIEKARANLELSKKRILSYGWKSNTTNITLVPNVSGYIIIPNEYLVVDGVSSNVKVRDWKLFDEENQTFVFSSGVECEVIEDLPLDDIEQSIKDYIYQDAKYNTYKSISGSNNEMAYSDRDVRLARENAIRNDANAIDGNLLSETSISDVLDRG